MLPVFLHVESIGLTLRAAQTCILVAALLCIVTSPTAVARLEGIRPALTRRIVAGLALAVFAGGHLHFVLNFPSIAGTSPERLWLPWNGMHAGGAIGSLLLAAPIICRWQGVPVGRLLDGLTPTIGLGIAIARLGCFLSGCCYGVPSDLPWAVVFPPGSLAHDLHADLGLVARAGGSLPVHPLQLYFAALGLGIAATALWYRPRRHFPGEVALLGLAVFGLGSFGFEFLRQPVAFRPLWFGIPQLAVVALALAAVAGSGLAAGAVRQRWQIRAATCATSR